jgi:hypothetical protein
MDEFTDERADLLNAVYNLARLIEQTKDPAKIAECIEQLNKVKSKLIALGSVKKTAGPRSPLQTRSAVSDGGHKCSSRNRLLHLLRERESRSDRNSAEPHESLSVGDRDEFTRSPVHPS